MALRALMNTAAVARPSLAIAGSQALRRNLMQSRILGLKESYSRMSSSAIDQDLSLFYVPWGPGTHMFFFFSFRDG